MAAADAPNGAPTLLLLPLAVFAAAVGTVFYRAVLFFWLDGDAGWMASGAMSGGFVLWMGLAGWNVRRHSPAVGGERLLELGEDTADDAPIASVTDLRERRSA